jgi:preprotein translocase subunit YajC
LADNLPTAVITVAFLGMPLLSVFVPQRKRAPKHNQSLEIVVINVG